MNTNILRVAEICGIVNEATTFPRIDPKIRNSNWETIRRHPQFLSYVNQAAEKIYDERASEIVGLNDSLKRKLKDGIKRAMVLGLKKMNDSNQIIVLDMRSEEGRLATEGYEVRNLVNQAFNQFAASDRTMKRAKSATANSKYNEAKVEQWIKDGVEQGIINEAMATEINKALFEAE